MPVHPGVYDVSLQGGFGQLQEESGAVECLAVNRDFSRLVVGSTVDFTADGPSPLVSAANVARILPGGTVFGCITTAPVSFIQPLELSFTEINGQTVKHAQPATGPSMRHSQFPRP